MSQSTNPESPERFTVEHPADIETEYCFGSNYDLLPPSARKFIEDEDLRRTADYNLGFRVARDT